MARAPHRWVTLRLTHPTQTSATGIEFDTHTLRLIAEANGAVKVAVSKLQ
jgi:hypothetical protein